MDVLFSDLKGIALRFYIDDDLLIHTVTESEHLEVLGQVFEPLRRAGLCFVVVNKKVGRSMRMKAN